MIKNTHILILEDNPTDAELEIRELRQAQIEFEVKCVDTREAFLAALNDFKPDIIISDYGLPQFNGLEALRLLKELDFQIPFILCTGSLTEEVAVKCMKEGATDYILKTSLKRLPSAVINALEKSESRQAKEEATAALRERELHFRSVVNSARDAIVSADSRGNIIFWNEGARKIFGYTEREAVGQSLSMLMPEKYREAHAQGMRRYSETGEANVIGKVIELQGLRKDGSEFPLELSLGVWETDDGKYFTGVMRDSTERKQTGEALQKNLSLLASTFEATAEGILAVDLDNNIVTFNKKFVEMWDIPEEIINATHSGEVINHISNLLKNPEDFSNQIKQSLEQPEEINYSTWELKDGRIYERYTQPQILDGKTIGRVLSYRDVTERKRAEEELNKKEGFLRAILENLTDNIVACDAEGNLTLFNRTIREFHEQPEASVPPEEWARRFELYNPDGKTLRVCLNLEDQN